MASDLVDVSLDARTRAWISSVAGGDVVRAEPFVHTRPMWVVDVRRADGTIVGLFARGDRGPASALNAVYDIGREALVVDALVRAGVPTPRPVAYSPQHRVLLLERVAGDSNFDAIADPVRRQTLADDFIAKIADLHAIDAASLGLDVIGRPETASDVALTELRIGEQLFGEGSGPIEPIMTLSRKWLYENVPAFDARVSFLQGDTGPGNFMFVGDRVTYLVDWEIAHFGDPMEDLAAICVRDMVTPFVDLPQLFARYEARSGTRVDNARIRYHRVSKCVRSLFAILSVAANRPDAPDSAVWQAWRLLYLRSACQALAEAIGVDPRADRSDRGADNEADEADEAALRHVDEAIREASHASDLVDVLRYLYRRADRHIAAARPAMGALADRCFSPLE